MNKDKQLETHSICKSCIHCFVCSQCDDSTLVCTEYKNERAYRKVGDVVNNIFNNLRILGYIDFDGSFVIRKDSFEGLEKAYKKQYESEVVYNESC